MKQLLLIVGMLMLTNNSIYAQNLCDGHENPLFGMPNELYRGRLKKDGQLYGNPYTMMDRIKYPIANDGFVDIRKLITQDSDLKKGIGILYKNMLAEANKSLSDVLNEVDNGAYEDAKNHKPSPLARWAKYNAFVFVIGLDENFTPMAPNSAKRLQFRNNAMDAFKNMNCRVYGKDWSNIMHNWLFTLPLVVPAAIMHDILDVNEKLQGRSHELVMWCEAYDWLKASAHDPELIAAGVEALKPYDEDRNGTSCMPRDNLRLFARNFYIAANGWFGPIENPVGWKKTDGIMAASAIGMAAVVLNDAGVETNWLRGIFQWVRPAPNYSPVNWDELGQKSWENLQEGWHVWPWNNVPQTNGDGTSGYAQGPGYFNYAMGVMLPYARAYENWGRIGIDKESTIKNMQKWQSNISLENGDMPTYDFTYPNEGTVGGLYSGSGIPFKHYNTMQFSMLTGLEPDFIALISNKKEFNHPQGATLLPKSGNGIIRTTDSKGSKHYCQLLAETGYALDKSSYSGEKSAEESDLGTISISADNESLIFDPTVIDQDNFQYSYSLNYDEQNNAYARIPTWRFGAGEYQTPSYSSMKEHRPSGFTLEMYFSVDEEIKQRQNLTRAIDVYNTKGRVYYILNDKFKNTTASGANVSDNDNGHALGIFLNGNGSSANGETTFLQTTQANGVINTDTGRFFKWFHPCSENRSWAILAHVAAMSPVVHERGPLKNRYPQVTNFYLDHLSGNNDITRTIDTRGFLKGWSKPNYGQHRTMQIEQEGDQNRFQTVLLPYKCENPEYPLIIPVENMNYVGTLIVFHSTTDTTILVPGLSKNITPTTPIIDSVRNLHLARMAPGITAILNPFLVSNANDTLISDAELLFLSRTDYTLIRAGACSQSIIPFKSAEIQNGTILKYNDTAYIKVGNTSDLKYGDTIIDHSENRLTVKYNHDDKFKYSGFISAASTVTFYLPDLQYGYLMVGKIGRNNQPSFHMANDVDSFMYITIAFNTPGEFTIELADPCLADCYFPPTNVTIDSVFIFDLGDTKPLGHDLDIVAPEGHLLMTNNSRMNICPNFVLVNKDTLLMKGMCAPEQRWIVNEDGSRTYLEPDTLPYVCNKTQLLADRAQNKTRNTILVNDRAALVLDSGSVTQIGINSTILIRNGGTLLVKKGATLIIGDSNCVNNRGELLAEPGSFVCVEQGAQLLFYNSVDTTGFHYSDTLDRHIVYLAHNNTTNAPLAISGVNTNGGGGKFNQGQNGIWSKNTCIDFCGWKFANGPDGVNNKAFGWCNVSKPKAYFTAPDTLCINRPYNIDATKSLNETSYRIEVCEYDTTTHTCSTVVVSITENGDYCLGKRTLFSPQQPGYYRTRLMVSNNCFEHDTFIKFLYVPHMPVATMSIPNEICPGQGTLTANGTGSASYISRCKHRWTIEPLDTDSMNIEPEYEHIQVKDWLVDSTAVSDSFNFPGYSFKGGHSYLVSLTVWGWCGDSTVWDTVHVPLSVNIVAQKTKTSHRLIGDPDVELTGVITGSYTGFTWAPANLLTSPNTLTVTTTSVADSTIYTLTAIGGGCTVTDTVIIKYKNYINLGYDSTVCEGTQVLLGNRFEPSLMLGIMHHLNSNSIGMCNYYEGSITDFKTSYAQFMYQHAYHQYNSLWNAVPHLTNFISQNATIFYSKPEYKNVLAAYYTLRLSDFYDVFDNYLLANNGDLQGLINVFQGQYEAYLQTQGTDLQTHTSIAFDDYHGRYEDWIANGKPDEPVVEWYLNDSLVSDYANRFMIDPTITVKTTFTMTVNNGTTFEIDQVVYDIENDVVPSFEPIYQIDSTIYFASTTTSSSNTLYLWDFGDGYTSTLKHPYHTFPAFDSTYYVCLEVTNSCGTYEHCDSVRVDSVGLGFFGYGKQAASGLAPEGFNNNTRKQAKQQAALGSLLENYPNPFNQSTIISYVIPNTFNQAELRITDVLGRVVQSYPIANSKGNLVFNAEQYRNGIYYTTLIVDGAVIKSKTMVLER